MRLPEIKLMNDEELCAEIARLEQKVLDAEDVCRTINDEASKIADDCVDLQLLTKLNQAYKEYILLKAEADYLNVIWKRRKVNHKWVKADSKQREFLSDYAFELDAEMFKTGDRLAKLREELS